MGQCAVFTGHDVQFGQLCAHQHAATLGVLLVFVFNVNCGFFTRLRDAGFGGAVRKILFLLAFKVAEARRGVVGLIVGSMTLLGGDVVVTTGGAWAQSLNDFHDMVRQQSSTVRYPASHAFLVRPAQGANASRQSATHIPPPLRDQSTNHVAAIVGGDVGVFVGGTTMTGSLVQGDILISAQFQNCSGTPRPSDGIGPHAGS